MPEVGCVLLARPTDSPGLYAQMVGRGTRTAPGKADCLVLDCADMTERHDLMVVKMLQGEPEQTGSKGGLKPGDWVEHRHDPARCDGNVVELIGDGFVTVLWAGRPGPEVCPGAALRRKRPMIDDVPLHRRRVEVGDAVAVEVCLLGGRAEGWYHYRDSRGTDRYTLGGPSDLRAVLQLVREAPGVWSGWEVSRNRRDAPESVYCCHEGGSLSEVLGATLSRWRPWRPIPWERVLGTVTPRQQEALLRWGMRRSTAGMSRAEACALMTTRIAASKIDAERKLRRAGRGAA